LVHPKSRRRALLSKTFLINSGSGGLDVSQEGDFVAIDFRLTAHQRELQLQSRNFARQVLSETAKAEILATPEERFAATKPAYEAMIAAGFLRKCIPVSAGGENTSLVETAIMVEELYAVNASLTLTLMGTVLGLLPLLIGGTKEQRSRLLVPFLKQAERRWRASARLNREAAPIQHLPHRVRAFVPPPGSSATGGPSMAEKAGFHRPLVGIARALTFCRYCAAPIQTFLPNEGFRCWLSSDQHQALCWSVQSIRSDIVRISCRASSSKE
jgi:hypothetical protein